MCSIHDNEDEEVQNFNEVEKIEQIDELQCRKCSNKAAITLREKDPYCEQCFLVVATHKFRATLGKSKIVKPNDKILVGHSGSHQSTALLHLIKAGMHGSVHKRLVFKIIPFFIDEGVVKQQSLEERQRFLAEIDQQVKEIGFEAYAMPLSEASEQVEENSSIKIDLIRDCSTQLHQNSAKDNQLIEIYDKLASNSSKIDFIKKLKHQMLIKAARKLGCNKIFIGDDANSLAIDILSNVALGRGSQLSLDVGFVDSRCPDVMILRPMKDFSRSEIEFYIKMHNLKVADCGSLIKSSSNTYSSIQQLTSQFISSLDAQFVGTVSTIYRTGEKMTAGKGSVHSDDEKCVYCHGLLDCMPLDESINALDATKFSRLMSLQGYEAHNGSDAVNNVENDVDNCREMEDGCNCKGKCDSTNKYKDISINNFHKCLCYGCRLIFNCHFNLKSLPIFVLERCRSKLCLESMREQITDFLL